jgi:hypothetical protein
MSPVPVASSNDVPRKFSGHEESLNALEGITPAPAEAPAVSAGPKLESESDAVSEVIVAPAEMVETPSLQTIPEFEFVVARDVDSTHAVQRASIDSASSYGSVGFSEHSTSSRSSSYAHDILASKTAETLYPKTFKASVADMPAPLRPRILPTTSDAQPALISRPQQLVPVETPERNAHEPANASLPVPKADRRVSIAVTDAESVPEEQWQTKTTQANKGTCRGCNQTIFASQRSVSSADGRLSGRYHKQCFVCQSCKAAFPTAEFYVHLDHPYCAYHYHELEDSLCATCGKGIEGIYMETANVAGRGKEKHHPECLKCTTCRVRLDHDYFELSGKVYCERDAFRLATMPKAHENAPSRPSPLIREYISSGDPGLIKGRNFPERRVTRLINTA